MNYTTKSTHYVSFDDLEKAIKLEYKQSFDVIDDLEQGNDTAYTLSLKKKALHDYELEALEYFRLTGKECSTYMLMQDMVNRNIIPEGEYVIEISW